MEVVIVGGGPVGCWTALQVMKRRPGAKVVVYERHETYQRDHVMSIDRRSFLFWAKPWTESDAFLQEAFATPATCRGDTKTPSRGASWRGPWWRRLPKTLDIRTLDLERILRGHCEGLGVSFVRRDIRTPAEVMDLHPGCAWFVAADGAHSRMRLGLWGKGHLRRRDIYPSLDFNYESHGQPGYLQVNTHRSMGHVYAENIGLEKDGTSAVNIRMVVSRKQYDAIPQATFKRPLTVTPDAAFWGTMRPDPHYGRTPREDFYELMALRAEHAGERPTDGPVTVTKIHLSQYHARRFARRLVHGNRTRSWFLVGDAAMGMPFYRAVNSGMILGSQLAFLLVSDRVPASMKAVTYDAVTRPFRIAREAVRIAAKEILIKVVKDVARPALRVVLRSPVGPLVERPVDRVVGYLKYGTAYGLAGAAR